MTIRAKVLEVAAALDRLDQAEGQVVDDPRREGLAEAIGLLLSDQPDRAQRVLLHFSRVYDPDWRTTMDLTTEKKS